MSVCFTLSNKVSDESWKKKVPPIDGFGTEGIGSMMQYHLLLGFLSDSLGVDFTYPGSTNFAHYSYTDSSAEEYFQSIDRFFNLPNLEQEWDEVISVSEITKDLLSHIEGSKSDDKKTLINLLNCHRQIEDICRQNMSDIFTYDRVFKIKNNLLFDGKKYFEEGLNVSLHLRTANPNDLPQEISSPLRELYVFEKDFIRYENLVNSLKTNIEQKQIILHIHSQGFTTDFSEFLKLKTDEFKIKLHIDDHPTSDIYHMANADLLIMSNSSFSWIASLLNPNQKIVRDNFTNGSFVHNSLKTNYDYTFFN